MTEQVHSELHRTAQTTVPFDERETKSSVIFTRFLPVPSEMMEKQA